MQAHFNSTPATGSTRGFTTVDPERQGVMAWERGMSALALKGGASSPVTSAPRGRQQDVAEKFVQFSPVSTTPNS